MNVQKESACSSPCTANVKYPPQCWDTLRGVSQGQYLSLLIVYMSTSSIALKCTLYTPAVMPYTHEDFWVSLLGVRLQDCRAFSNSQLRCEHFFGLLSVLDASGIAVINMFGWSQPFLWSKEASRSRGWSTLVIFKLRLGKLHLRIFRLD